MCESAKSPTSCLPTRSGSANCLVRAVAIGPVQFSWPHGVAENSFTKPEFGNILSIFPGKTANAEFTKSFLVRTPEIY